ncbi:Hypp4896 [Branchiostoma lanceolatum]|uniref:Hypp4896 protein n=1 Tax=Branchiostoma lanceolatum TaxID=7740 RepID=A0A8K0AH54_BRALA|nr:Hypp4896 [Branchiostoma lanceolatum]
MVLGTVLLLFPLISGGSPAGDGAGTGTHAVGGRADTEVLAVTEALQRAVRFFSDSYTETNLDGLYGLRVAEVEIKSFHLQLTLTAPTISSGIDVLLPRFPPSIYHLYPLVNKEHDPA